MAIVAAVLQIGRDGHLRHAAGRMGAEGLQPLDFLAVTSRQDPADAHTGRKRLGEAGTVDDPPLQIVGFERLDRAHVEHQLAVDIVLDDLDIEIRGQLQQLLLACVRHAAAQRVAQPRGQHQRLDRPLARGQLQGLDAQAGIGIAGYFDDLQPQQIGQLQQAVIAGRFGGDQIARTGQDTQGHLQGIDATMGDDDLVGADHHAGITHANRYLAAQRFEAGTEHVAEGPRALEAGDLRQLLMQRACRQVIHVGHRRAERHQPLAPGFAEHLVDDAAAGNQLGAFDLGDVRGGGRERWGMVDVEARLRARTNHPLVFEIGVGLQHRRMADAELHAHLAHRRHALARPIDTAPDVVSQLLSDTLVKQQIGHFCRFPPTEPKQ